MSTSPRFAIHQAVLALVAGERRQATITWVSNFGEGWVYSMNVTMPQGTEPHSNVPEGDLELVLAPPTPPLEMVRFEAWLYRHCSTDGAKQRKVNWEHALASFEQLLAVTRKAEAALVGALQDRGYEPGSSVDGWVPQVAVEVRTLAEVRAALEAFTQEKQS